jgi:hypothetical protein
VVPRGGTHFFFNHNDLSQSGTRNCSLKSLGFLCLESHRFWMSCTVFGRYDVMGGLDNQ